MFVVFVEAAGVCWLYGVERFSRDVECMLGYRPGIFWRICWTYISPSFLLVNTKLFCVFHRIIINSSYNYSFFQLIFVFSLLGYEDMMAGEYIYPEWSINVGWALTASSILCIPGYILYLFCITPGPFLHVSESKKKNK